MALAIHSQDSFIRGILQSGSITDSSYFSSVQNCVNYFITTGGDLERRKGSDVVLEFTEPQSIKKIIPLGEGWIYLTDNLLLKYVSENSNGPQVIPLYDYFRIKYNEEFDNLSEEIITFNRFSSPLVSKKSELLQTPIDISSLEDEILVAGSKQSRFVIKLENGLIVVQPPYMNTTDPVRNFIKHPFYPIEYDKVPNPFRVAEGIIYAPANEQARLVIDSEADLKNGTCRAWINIDPSQTLDNNVKVDVGEVGLRDLLFKPIAFNVIPRELPVLSTAEDYSNQTVYTNFQTLENLNDNISLHTETTLTNAQKAFLLSNLLFSRKYMVVPYEFVNETTYTGITERSNIYNDASVTTPAVTIAKITGVVLSRADISTPIEAVEAVEADPNATPPIEAVEAVEGDPDHVTPTTLVEGFNSNDSIAVNLEIVNPSPFSFSEQLKIGGTFIPDNAGALISAGYRVNNDISTEELERTPYIIFSNFSNLSKNTVSGQTTGPAYQMDVRNRGALNWTTYILDRPSVVAGVGIEFSANPTTASTAINWNGDWEMRVRYLANKTVQTGSFIEWESAVTRASSSKVYAKCLILEIGVPSPYSPNRDQLTNNPENVKRRIGGNDYDGGNNIGSNVLFSLQNEFSAVASTGFGAVYGSENRFYVDFGENLGSSNNILAYLNGPTSPDYAKVSYSSTVALDRAIYFGLIDFLNNKLPTTFPDGWQFAHTQSFMLEYFNGAYRNFTQSNIYRVLDSRGDTTIENIYIAFDENVMLAQTKSGIYEVNAERLNAVLRSKENTVGNIQLFLRQMVSITRDSHVAVSTLSFDRFGYTTNLFGRNQRPLLQGLKDMIYNDQYFFGVKDNGELVSFTLFNNEIAGWSRMSFGEQFKAQNVLLKDQVFHVIGAFDDPAEKKILAVRKGDGTDDYVDFRGLNNTRNVESEVVFNPLVLVGQSPLGSLYPASIKKVRVYSANFGQFVLTLSGENTEPLNIDVSQQDVDSGMFLPPKKILRLGQETFIDVLAKLHIKQNDAISGGLLHGADIEGDIGGPD